jgi:hypothetical protein
LAHPQSGNPNAILFCSFKKNKMSTRSLASIFHNYKQEVFPALLRDDIPQEDKDRIRDLLKKPWNPYVFRHTDLTRKSSILKESELRQHAGWARGSQMHVRYVHLSGSESNKTLLRDAGVLPQEDQVKDVLKPKECPQCSNFNQPDARYCGNCKMVLSYQGYAEVIELEAKKDKEIQDLTKTVEELKSKLLEVNTVSNQVEAMREQVAVLQRDSQGFKGLANLLQETVDLAKMVNLAEMAEQVRTGRSGGTSIKEGLVQPKARNRPHH